MFKKILRKILSKIFTLTGRKIIQFSPQRSGSTLVFNILKDLFPTHDINKKHNYSLDDKNFPTVTTYRHPYDSIASLFLKDNIIPTKKNMEDTIIRFRENGWNDFFFNKFNSQNILFLRYEDFYNNFDYMLDSLEDYFYVKISKKQRFKLKAKYEISNVKKKIEKFKDFSEYDDISHFHGNHISKFSGSSNTYKKIFTSNQIEILDKYFGDEKKYLNYD